MTEQDQRELADLYDIAEDAFYSVHDLDVPHADYARAVVDAVLAELQKWQPIETAPKDQLIDIWLRDGVRWCDCYYDRICDEWRTSRPSGRLLTIKARYVTHWMLPPDAPRGGAA